MIDYLEIAQKYHGFCALYSSKHRLVEALKSTRHKQGRNDGFLTDVPKGIQLSDDDYVRVRYDVQTMRWIANRPSRIKYPTAKELIKEYRREYAEKWG